MTEGDTYQLSEAELAELRDSPARTVGVHPKVAAASRAGALSIVVVWIVGQFGGVTVPAEVASAFTTLIAAGAGYVKGVG